MYPVIFIFLIFTLVVIFSLTGCGTTKEIAPEPSREIVYYLPEKPAGLEITGYSADTIGSQTITIDVGGLKDCFLVAVQERGQMVMAPDYANIDTTDCISNNGETWTADRAGYILLGAAANGIANATFYLNNVGIWHHRFPLVTG
ncbi:MAG: hypothetical protein LBD99_00615 [Candidatus Margulisbacteria bacterium]|nr:hypothetical protein [Candidatus Margulisiibacteriota bacterium]